MPDSNENHIDDSSPASIVLVGNPNVGKSVIFSYLTDKYVIVSNFPGTTVEVSRGKMILDNQEFSVIDTPGTNSFIPQSEDEKVSRDLLLSSKHDVVLQVADSKNLGRALFNTLQLIEMGVPLIIDLNMKDEARSRGINIDIEKLQSIIGVPVFSTTATRRKGLPQLKKQAASPRVSDFSFTYSSDIEKGITEIEELLPDLHISKRSMAIMLLSRDKSLSDWMNENVSPANIEKINTIIAETQKISNDTLNNIISAYRLNAVERILNEVYSIKSTRKKQLSKEIGALSMHPVWGIGFLLAVLYLTYWFVGLIGAGTLVDFFETVIFSQYVNPVFISIFDKLLPFEHVHEIEKIIWELSIPFSASHEISTGISFTRDVITPVYTIPDGVSLTLMQQVMIFIHDLFVGQYGLITMALSYGFAIVLPIVGTFFILFSFLEDSGYLPRLAVMLNKIFKAIGLNGKAILPMVLGLGCDTMATMTTRILESRKERIITILLLALGVPCSAQLGVILGMIGSISVAATIIWISIIILSLYVVGYLSAKLIPGEASSFILELPPIRKPVISNLVIKTFARIEWYFKEVIPLFLLGTFALFMLEKTHLLALIRKAGSPIIETFLGLPAQTTDAFLVGFFRRDYGAVYLLDAAMEGMLNTNQILISMVTITLFVPCIANVFMIIKELGMKMAVKMVLFIFPFAFLVGGIINFILKTFNINL
ncbi:MAG: ferrous iron transporter B [bacterium]|nr:ferrous iron transporter B [bacterium]